MIRINRLKLTAHLAKILRLRRLDGALARRHKMVEI